MKFKVIKSTIELFYFITLHMAEIEGDLVFWTFVFENIFVLDIVDQHPKWYIPTSLAECKFQRKWCGELVAPREAGHQARGTNSGLFSQMDLLIMRNQRNWLNQIGQKLGQGRNSKNSEKP